MANPDPKPKPSQDATVVSASSIDGVSSEAISSELVKKSAWGKLGELAKYTAIIAIAIFFISTFAKKMQQFTLAQIWDGLQNVPANQIALALLFTALNFVVLTGYDWIAVNYLKKKLSLPKIMAGAIVGYATSNILGWMLGGSAVRYRLYTRWGFTLLEVIAFVSILSITFWLGMFLLAGVAFVILPVELPQEYRDRLHFPIHYFGIFFLACVAIYLLTTVLVRKPIKLGGQEFSLPPFKLSMLQLLVSASDFMLASLVLYLLLPEGTANYSTVLVSYLAAMIVTVTLHVPGGVGILELIVLEIIADETAADPSLKLAVTCGLVLYRAIYYLLPGIVALVIFCWNEVLFLKARRRSVENDIEAGI